MYVYHFYNWLFMNMIRLLILEVLPYNRASSTLVYNAWTPPQLCNELIMKLQGLPKSNCATAGAVAEMCQKHVRSLLVAYSMPCSVELLNIYYMGVLSRF